MTPKEFKEKMQELISGEGGWDFEARHSQMDDLMCEALSDLGYGDGVALFKEADKWYA